MHFLIYFNKTACFNDAKLLPISESSLREMINGNFKMGKGQVIKMDIGIPALFYFPFTDLLFIYTNGLYRVQF
jgi:hypothetical protein